jgi:hypothetical protein
MNRDDIIRMAREAMPEIAREITDEELERFAALVAAAEREACAQLCYSYGPFDGTVSTEVKLARAIRARGEEPKRHPGYIMGEHWLQAAYTRICTGETEAEVMADYGWQRESR